MPYDAIVIGSGFGGSVTACRLAERGAKVLVLERGRRWSPGTFPRKPQDPWIWSHEEPERQNGWLDLRCFPNMAVAQGAGVGGGSLIYANVSTEAPPETFKNGWPKEITYNELKPHYDEVARFMNVMPIPDNQWTARTRLIQIGAQKLGQPERFRKLDLAVSFDKNYSYDRPDPHNLKYSVPYKNAQGVDQGTCVHCGCCVIGCPTKAKNTLDLNYLAWAERKGAEIRALHLVTNIEPLDRGYKVSFDRLENGTRIAGSETARIVVVSAGSLGSTELLLRCRDETKSLQNLSPRLGYNWSSNGDFLTPAINTVPPASPTKGPTITAVIDFLDGSIKDAHGLPRPFWVQDGGFPDVAIPYLASKPTWLLKAFGASGLVDAIQRAARDADPLSDVMPWFAQGVDAADGQLSLRRPWWLFGRKRLRLKWDVQKSAACITAIVDMHKRLAHLTGGTPLVPPFWSISKDLITPHPLGGCNMGNTAADGVVDHRCAVFGHPNLYVIDAAVIPEALGVNPSRTIAAVAERAARMLQV